jgi:hypothetical protein
MGRIEIQIRWNLIFKQIKSNENKFASRLNRVLSFIRGKNSYFKQKTFVFEAKIKIIND